MAIQNYLRSAEFSYSLQSPVQGGYDGNGLSVLADFLAQKSGYCIHFASAMAVMARLQGIPSRIAVGYAPGRSTGATVSVAGQGPLPEFEVDSRDADAWPELDFPGLGWVPVRADAVPRIVPAYATEAAAPSGASTNDRNDALTPGDGSTPAPVPSFVPVPVPGAGDNGAADPRAAQSLYGIGTMLLLALLVASPRLVRAPGAAPQAERRRPAAIPAPRPGRPCRPGRNCGTWPRTTAWRPERARRRGISRSGCAPRRRWGNPAARTGPGSGQRPP